MSVARFVGIVLCGGLLCCIGVRAAEVGVPLKPDPPFAVDGNLSDWAAVPNAFSLTRPEQVVWGRNAWESPQDLSGTVHIAWRQEYLFVAADVVDDKLCQTQRSEGLWKGDHVELYIDAQPELEAARDAFGAGQFQIALSVAPPISLRACYPIHWGCCAVPS